MIDLYKKLSQHRLVRYIFIGGISYVIEVIALFFFSITLSLGPAIGVAISFWIGLIASFLLQKIFAFQDKAMRKSHLAKQIISYATLVVFNYIFTIYTVSALAPHIGLFVSRTLVLLITTAWNFLIYSKVIFKRTET